MFYQWPSKASAISLAVVFIYATLPLHCLGAVQYAQTCYFPDQSVAAGYTACNITAGDTQTSASACCLHSPYAYCTDSGLCYTNGLLSRGGCTDRTWTSPSCPSLCNNVVREDSVTLFPCHGGTPNNTFQCGTDSGPGDCSITFPLPDQKILLRADQEPGAPNAVNYSDPSATCVNKAALSSTAAASSSSSSPSDDEDYDNDGPSLTAVGLGVGLPLGFLLLVSFGIILWQERRIQRSKKRHHSAVAVDQRDLVLHRKPKAATSGEHVGTSGGGGGGHHVWRPDEMPPSYQRTVNMGAGMQEV